MSDPKPRTELDPLFKEILVWLGKQLNFTPQTQVEISRLPRTIDAVIHLPDPHDQTRLAWQTPFTRLREHNQIEFKGKNDRFGLNNYHMVRGRCMFYMADKTLEAAQMTVSVVCARRPKVVIEADETAFEPLGDGYYLGNEAVPTLLIVINELLPIPKNYPLLLFASSKNKFKEFLETIAADPNYRFYLYLAYAVQPDIITEDATMTALLEGYTESPYLNARNLSIFVRDLGHHVMPFVTDEALLHKSPALQKLFADKTTIKNTPAFKELRQELQCEDEQRTLLRLLRRRFKTIPEQMVKRVEATTDRQLLEHWQDSLLDINDLAEFERLMQTTD